MPVISGRPRTGAILLLIALAGCSRNTTVLPATPGPSPSPSATAAASATRIPPAEKPVNLSDWPLNPAVSYAGRNYSTVQKAVDVVKPGDTLELPQGIYDQTLLLSNKKGLTLRGLGEGAFFNVSRPVGAAIVVDRSSGITFERILVRRAQVSTVAKEIRDGANLVTILDSNGVSFFHCFLDGAVMHPPEGDGVVVKGGASILFSDSFLRWAVTGLLLDHVEGQVGVDRSVVAENTRGILVKGGGGRFMLNVRRSRVINGEQNLSIGGANASVTDSIVLLTKGAGDTTPASFGASNKSGTDAAALTRLPDPQGSDWSWEPPYGLLDVDATTLHR